VINIINSNKTTKFINPRESSWNWINTEYHEFD